MSSLLTDIRIQLNGTKGALFTLIGINVAIFVLLGIVHVFEYLIAGNAVFSADINQWLLLPASFSNMLYQPWSIVSYMFMHSGIFHILFNMLGLYWFGGIIAEYLGNKRVWALYFWGGLAGGLLYLLFYNVFPTLRASASFTYILGASGAVMAMVAGAATLLPTYSFHLLFFGAVQIRYIAIVYFLVDVLQIGGSNTGGHIAHIGGAIMGFSFIKLLQKGTDLSNFTWLSLKRKPSLHAKVQNGAKKQKTEVDQEEVDRILDKISSKGYSSLTDKEKQTLFKASNN